MINSSLFHFFLVSQPQNDLNLFWLVFYQFQNRYSYNIYSYKKVHLCKQYSILSVGIVIVLYQKNVLIYDNQIKIKEPAKLWRGSMFLFFEIFQSQNILTFFPFSLNYSYFLIVIAYFFLFSSTGMLSDICQWTPDDTRKYGFDGVLVILL